MKEKREQREQRVVKRYRNRKLYDTLDSCYVTLEDIADLVRSGEDVRVIDNSSGEDLTSVTLAQIILEEERRKKETLPLNTLFQLIRSGGETIYGFVQKSFGEGVKDIHNVKDEIYDHLNTLIKRGSISHDESNKILDSIKEFVAEKVKPTVESVQNIPSVRSEVKEMKKRLKDLEEKLTTYGKQKKKK